MFCCQTGRNVRKLGNKLFQLGLGKAAKSLFIGEEKQGGKLF